MRNPHLHQSVWHEDIRDRSRVLAATSDHMPPPVTRPSPDYDRNAGWKCPRAPTSMYTWLLAGGPFSCLECPCRLDVR